MLDLGSGTGRFTPRLAQLFGGEVYGVEPNDAMRGVAERRNGYSRVRYLRGYAEAIPLQASSCDLILLYEVVHHTRHEQMAAEARRVLKPDGKLLVATRHANQQVPPPFARYFPRAWQLHLAELPRLDELHRTLDNARLRTVAVEEITLRVTDTLAHYRWRLALLAISPLARLTEVEIADGFAMLDAEIAEGNEAPVRSTICLIVAEPAA